MATFNRVRLVVGRIQSAVPFPGTRKPAYQLVVDFGPEIGTRQSSAQLTFGYPDPAGLVGQAVVAVLNFPRRLVAGFRSEILCLGFYAGDDRTVKLMQPIKSDADGDGVIIGRRVGLVGEPEPQEEAEITIDVFGQLSILLGQVISVAGGTAEVRCGPSRGVLQCTGGSAGLKVGQRLAVLDCGDQIGAILAVRGGIPLTTSEDIPEGAQLC